jgi:hypothetical protein
MKKLLHFKLFSIFFLKFIFSLCFLDTAEAADNEIRFSSASEFEEKVVIAAVGDLLLHSPLQKQALREADGYRSLWSEVEVFLRAADLRYANLEGPIALGLKPSGRKIKDPGRVYDGEVYTDFPLFNYHPSLIDSLLESDFTIVSTANNHALDRGSLGVDLTIEQLRAKGLLFAGTHASTDEERDWTAWTHVKGIKIAWIACTSWTNRIPDTGFQVLHCYEDAELIERRIQEALNLEAADTVIVTPHWGTEYSHQPQDRQREMSKRFLEAGALAVVSSHPHVIQPWEKVVTQDGREGFILYSLGNFVSGQSGIAKRTSMILYLGLGKTKGGVVKITGARYLPLQMTQKNGRWSVHLPEESTESGQKTLKLADRILGNQNRLSFGKNLRDVAVCDFLLRR